MINCQGSTADIQLSQEDKDLSSQIARLINEANQRNAIAPRNATMAMHHRKSISLEKGEDPIKKVSRKKTKAYTHNSDDDGNEPPMIPLLKHWQDGDYVPSDDDDDHEALVAAEIAAHETAVAELARDLVEKYDKWRAHRREKRT